MTNDKSGMTLKQRTQVFIQESPARMAVILAVALFTVTCIMHPLSFNVTAIGSIIMLTVLLSIAAAGQTMVLIGGGLDFTVGAVMSSAAIMTTYIMDGQEGRFFIVLALSLAMGAAVGLLNGVCTVKIGLPAMIVTMAISNVVTRLQYVFTQGSPSGFPSRLFVQTVVSRIGGVFPSILFYAAIIYPIVFFLLNRSRFGKQVYLVGANPVAARLNGVKVNKVRILTFVFSGMMAAFAGMLGAGFMGVARCQLFDDYAFNSLVAVIIGGTTLAGGIGSFTGTIAGALLLTVLGNTLTIMAFPQPVRFIIQGIVMMLLLFMYNRTRAVRQ
jgi:ribose transport system permease protein